MEILIFSAVLLTGFGVWYFKYRKPKQEEPKEPPFQPLPIDMRFEVGNIITTGKVEDGIREIVEVHNGYYIWKYHDVPDKYFDSRNSSDPELVYWKLYSEEHELPPIETPEPPDIPEEEEPEDELKPTEENPVVYEVVRDRLVRLVWEPVEGVERYLVEIREEGKKYFITRGRDVREAEYVDDQAHPGESAIYKVWAYTNFPQRYEIGTVETQMPELPLIEEGTEFPDKLPDNLIEYPVYVDFDSTEDQTAIIEEQLENIPNGTPEQYVAIVFHGKDGAVRVEGDLKNNARGENGGLGLLGRKYTILKGVGEEKIKLYSTDPAVPLGSSVGQRTHSLRCTLKIKHFTNIWLYNVDIEGGNKYLGNTIGTTPELTPDWWWMDYRPADPETIEGFENLAPDQKWYELYKKSTRVAHWWLKEREQDLLAGREVPGEIVNEPDAGKKAAYYRVFLQQNIPTGTMVPRNPDTGASNTAMVWQKEWEFEAGIDASEGSMLKLTNCKVTHTFGDGLTLHNVKGVRIDDDCEFSNTGRQNVGLGKGVEYFRMGAVKLLNPRRAVFDPEPYYHTDIIDGVYVEGAYIDGRVAAVGSGRVNNMTFKNCERITTMSVQASPDRRRENLVVDGTKHIGGFQTPLAICRFYNYDNVTVTNNFIWCPDTHYAGRRAFEIKGGGDKILIGGNTYKFPSIVEIVECENDSEVTINEDYPDNVYVISYKDGRKEIIGDNLELLEKLK